jgi:hypothetical protein
MPYKRNLGIHDPDLNESVPVIPVPLLMFVLESTKISANGCPVRLCQTYLTIHMDERYRRFLLLIFFDNLSQLLSVGDNPSILRFDRNLSLGLQERYQKIVSVLASALL